MGRSARHLRRFDVETPPRTRARKPWRSCTSNYVIPELIGVFYHRQLIERYTRTSQLPGSPPDTPQLSSRATRSSRLGPRVRELLHSARVYLALAPIRPRPEAGTTTLPAGIAGGRLVTYSTLNRTARPLVCRLADASSLRRYSPGVSVASGRVITQSVRRLAKEDSGNGSD